MSDNGDGKKPPTKPVETVVKRDPVTGRILHGSAALNPGGRPLSKPFTDAIKRLGPMKPPKEIIDKFRRFFPLVPDEEWTYYLVGAARRLAAGKVEDFREAADRVEGRSAQTVTLHTTTNERDMSDDELKTRNEEMQRRIEELEHPN